MSDTEYKKSSYSNSYTSATEKHGIGQPNSCVWVGRNNDALTMKASYFQEPNSRKKILSNDPWVFLPYVDIDKFMAQMGPLMKLTTTTSFYIVKSFFE